MASGWIATPGKTRVSLITKTSKALQLQKFHPGMWVSLASNSQAQNARFFSCFTTIQRHEMPILQTTEIFRRSKAVVVEAICCDFFPQILLAPVFKKELQIYSLKKKKNDASNDTKCEHHHLSWCPGNNHENHPQEPHHYPATPIHRRLRRNRQLLPLVQPTRKKKTTWTSTNPFPGKSLPSKPQKGAMVFIRVRIFWTKRDRNPRFWGEFQVLMKSYFAKLQIYMKQTGLITWKTTSCRMPNMGSPHDFQYVATPASHEFLLLPNPRGHLSRKKNAGQTKRQNSRFAQLWAHLMAVQRWNHVDKPSCNWIYHGDSQPTPP